MTGIQSSVIPTPETCLWRWSIWKELVGWRASYTCQLQRITACLLRSERRHKNRIPSGRRQTHRQLCCHSTIRIGFGNEIAVVVLENYKRIEVRRTRLYLNHLALHACECVSIQV